MFELDRRGALPLLVALVVAACDLPTEIPRWDTEWDVVVLTDTVATADLLPEHVVVTDEGFAVESFSSEAHVRLGDVCELCTCFAGPIPPIEIAPHDWPVKLPPGVLSASIVRGSADVVIHNEVGFDVLDDGEGGKGFLDVRLTDSWTDEVLASLVVAEPFPPGDSLVLSFDLPAVVLSPRIVARVSGRTPGSGCDSIPLTPESGFRTSVSLRDVVSDAVQVIVSNADLEIPSRNYALPGWLIERLRPGEAEVVLEVDIDTSVPAGLELDISAAGRPDELFTEEAALYTPLLLPAGGPAIHRVRKEYLVDLAALQGADRLWVATEARVAGNPVVTLGGGESLAYSVRLRARVPTR